MTGPAAGPVAVRERSPALDVLRGAAIFGVLLVNMEFHRGPALHLQSSGIPEAGTRAVDEAAAFLIAWLGMGKAYTVLAFLFGYGVHLQWRRAQAAGVRFAPRHLRRLVGLFVFGLLHTVLLFFGDVLTFYALAGTTLLLAVRAGDRSLLWWAAVLTAGPALLYAVAVLAVPPLGAEDDAGFVADARQAVAAYTGGAGEAIEQRIRDAALGAWGALVGVPQVVALFLVGIWCARRRVLEAPGEHRALLRRIALVGIPVGLVLNLPTALAWVAGTPADAGAFVVVVLAYFLAPPVLAAGYVAAIALAADRLAGLGPLGRVSLTAYLLQSAVAAFLFTSYGLELYGRTGAAAGLGITVLVFTGEVLLAQAWLRRHETGPFERLLRTVTYGRNRR